jgi:hypothetical protein
MTVTAGQSFPPLPFLYPSLPPSLPPPSPSLSPPPSHSSFTLILHFTPLPPRTHAIPHYPLPVPSPRTSLECSFAHLPPLTPLHLYALFPFPAGDHLQRKPGSRGCMPFLATPRMRMQQDTHARTSTHAQARTHKHARTNARTHKRTHARTPSKARRDRPTRAGPHERTRAFHTRRRASEAGAGPARSQGPARPARALHACMMVLEHTIRRAPTRAPHTHTTRPPPEPSDSLPRVRAPPSTTPRSPLG